MKNLNARIVVYGILLWLVPMGVALPFFGPEGLNIDIFLFKSIMKVVWVLTSAFLIISFFKRVSGDYVRYGIILGLVWLVINLGLDVMVIVPLSGQSLGEYFQQIGLGYLLMPIICIMVGKVLEDKA